MVISVISLLLAAYCVLAIVLYFMQRSLTFYPTKNVPYNPGDIGLEYEKVQLNTPDGLILSAWFVPAKNAAATLLFCHANGGNMAYYLDTIDIFNKLGLNCFIFDYRGYGDSGGEPGEMGIYIDAQTAYDWLKTEKNTPAEDIIIFGRSLGGSIAAHLAGNVKAGGLIVESGFTSYADIAQKFYPYIMVRPFAKYSFNTLEYIKKVKCPILFIHSRSDEVVPFEFGLRLYSAARGAKEFAEIFGGHNDGFLYSGQIYRESLADWLEFLKEYRMQEKCSKIKIVS
ncbi:MAG: alpha/beta hydrolase [Phycisphaerae bacterium]